MGANSDMGFPFGKMKKEIIAFDIDGTLRCNCTETCRNMNKGVAELALMLNRMKNTTVIAWSGGGKQYAQDYINSNGLLQMIFGQKCFSKTEYKVLNVDIAVDDIQDCKLGKINLIVNEKKKVPCNRQYHTPAIIESIYNQLEDKDND